MSYGERAYFDGDHCAHVAAYETEQRYAERRKRFVDAHNAQVRGRTFGRRSNRPA